MRALATAGFLGSLLLTNASEPSTALVLRRRIARVARCRDPPIGSDGLDHRNGHQTEE
jgi:hypothetical protein